MLHSVCEHRIRSQPCLRVVGGIEAAAAVDFTIGRSDMQHAGQSDFGVFNPKKQKTPKAAESQISERHEKATRARSKSSSL